MTTSIILSLHQTKAVEWLKSRNNCGLIYADVGTGKTFIALEAVSATSSVLIFTTASTVEQWRGEIEKFYGSRPRPSFLVLNYEKLLNDDVLKSLLAMKFDAIVADEAEKIKNPTAKTVKRFRKIAAPARIALSGTPSPNSLHELWNVTDWISPGILWRNFYEFRLRECLTNPRIPQQIVGYRDRDKLLTVFKSHFFRITDEVLGLVEAERDLRWLELSVEERKEYDRIKTEGVALLEGKKYLIPNMLVEIMRRLQFIALTATKTSALAAALAESDEKTLIFSESSTMLEKLADVHGGELLIGQMSSADRAAALARFKDDPSCRYFWMSSAGTHGLNLQHAKRVIHYGLPPHNDKLKQRLGRARRRGQTETVKEILLLVKDSEEERLWQIILRKKRLGEALTRGDYKTILDL